MGVRTKSFLIVIFILLHIAGSVQAQTLEGVTCPTADQSRMRAIRKAVEGSAQNLRNSYLCDLLVRSLAALAVELAETLPGCADYAAETMTAAAVDSGCSELLDPAEEINIEQTPTLTPTPDWMPDPFETQNNLPTY